MQDYPPGRVDWQARRGQRMKSWLKIRVGLWLAMVAIVIGLNFLMGGGHFWGLGFIVITGVLLVFRIASMWFLARRRRHEWQQGRRGPGNRPGRGGYTPPPAVNS